METYEYEDSGVVPAQNKPAARGRSSGPPCACARVARRCRPQPPTGGRLPLPAPPPPHTQTSLSSSTTQIKILKTLYHTTGHTQPRSLDKVQKLWTNLCTTLLLWRNIYIYMYERGLALFVHHVDVYRPLVKLWWSLVIITLLFSRISSLIMQLSFIWNKRKI